MPDTAKSWCTAIALLGISAEPTIFLIILSEEKDKAFDESVCGWHQVTPEQLNGGLLLFFGLSGMRLLKTVSRGTKRVVPSAPRKGMIYKRVETPPGKV